MSRTLKYRFGETGLVKDKYGECSCHFCFGHAKARKRCRKATRSRFKEAMRVDGYTPNIRLRYTHG